MSDEKKYTANEAAKMVLKKAYEMIKDREDMKKCGEPVIGEAIGSSEPKAEPKAEADAPQENKEESSEPKQESNPAEDKDSEDGSDKESKLKKFMAKKEEKRVVEDVPSDLKDISKEKDYEGQK